MYYTSSELRSILVSLPLDRFFQEPTKEIDKDAAESKRKNENTGER